MAASGKAKSYHHGDLRRTLLDAALQLASERGIHSFTLREVARQAGVSHAAPYHHFADKSALVEALAVESFTAMTHFLQEATDAAPGTALDKLLACGRAYVHYALLYPAQFRLMYRPELRQSISAARPQGPIANSKAVDEAGRATYQVLQHTVIACQEEGSIAISDPAPLALTAWSTVHGLATLLLDGTPGGLLNTIHTQTDAEQIAHLVTTTLIEGLRIRQEQ